MMAGLDGAAVDGTSGRKRHRSSASSIAEIQQAQKVLNWGGCPARSRVQSNRSTRSKLPSVAESQIPFSEAASMVAEDDVFETASVSEYVPSITPLVQRCAPMQLRSRVIGVVGSSDNEAPAAAQNVGVEGQDPVPADVPADVPSSGSGSYVGAGEQGPADPPLGHQAAVFNASNLRTNYGRHNINQNAEPSSGRRHPVSGGLEMLADGVSVVNYSGFTTRPQKITYTPVGSRLWIQRRTRPCELTLKQTVVSQGLIHSLRDSFNVRR